MSLDFLVCKKDSTIIAAIELDDITHSRQSRIEADTKKNKALTDAGIRLIRWQAGNLPSEITIRNELLKQVTNES
jgi:very-short-patch-repair endonuclease